MADFTFDKVPATLTELIRSVQAGRYHGLVAHTYEYAAAAGRPVSKPTIRYHLEYPERDHSPTKREVYALAWEVLANLHSNRPLMEVRK